MYQGMPKAVRFDHIGKHAVAAQRVNGQEPDRFIGQARPWDVEMVGPAGLEPATRPL